MRNLTKVKMAKVTKAEATAKTTSTARARVGITTAKAKAEGLAEAQTARATSTGRAKVGMTTAQAEVAKAADVSESSGFKRSACAVANTLELVGDKWSLLVVRDLLHGKRTYGELADSPEGIPTNILAERLRRLESAGIISSAAYQDRPVRYAYTLTKKGIALGDVLLSIVRWGKEYIPGTRTLRDPGGT
jgi:DNA-binding HxlR family transcriptional regulator